MRAFKLAVFLAASIVSSALYAVEAGTVSLSHYESLQRLSIQPSDGRLNGDAQKIQASTPVALSFDALGRVFELQLVANERLTSAIPRDDIFAYRGQLADHPGSWARIVVYNGAPRGLIWDGNEMFAVEAPGDSLLPITQPVIYRFSDALIAPGAMSCASGPSASSASASLQQLMGELGTVAAQAPGAISELTMGAVGDFEFTSDKGGDAAAAAAITTRLNIVDGFFSDQLGVQIRVQDIATFSDASDPFSDTGVANTLLLELSNYRDVTASQNAHGLTHLYTGRDVSASTVGIAWNGALCDDYYGAGLSEGRQGSTFDALIAAHEIGHNFGAPHDGEAGSECVAETGDFIMAPQINGVQQFSSCSIAQMQDDIAGAQCITAIPAVDMSVRLINASTTLLLGADTELEYALSNNGTLEATSVMVDFTLPANFALDTVIPSSGTCTDGAGTISCDMGTVAGSSSHTVTIAGSPSAIGAGAISATVTSDVDERPSNNQSVLQFVVDPAVDLIVNTPSSNTVLVNSVTTVTAILDNQSDLAATGVTLSISFGNGLQANAASWSIGTCTVTPQQIECQSANFAARSSSTLSVDVRGITAGNKNFTVDLASVESEANPGNNSISASVRVNEPRAKDGGGGVTSPAFLLLLAMSTVIGRRRPKVSIME
ncbi:MAG: M12 family metallo-peptidase [Gammaproteobacteria bacterium]|nr:M12 family metallo-peptidase [Gammaproteobacteria bacterium]